MTDILRDRFATTLALHRWKDMGVDWCSCECGAILKGDTSLTGFPADTAFREHLGDQLAKCVRNWLIIE